MGRTIEEKILIQLYTKREKKKRERERQRWKGRERANGKRFCQFLSTVPLCIGKGLVPESSQDENNLQIFKSHNQPSLFASTSSTKFGS